MTYPAILMLVVVDAHPGLPGVVGTEQGLELVYCAGQVERRIIPSRCGFAEAQRIRFLNTSTFVKFTPPLAEWYSRWRGRPARGRR